MHSWFNSRVIKLVIMSTVELAGPQLSLQHRGLVHSCARDKSQRLSSRPGGRAGYTAPTARPCLRPPSASKYGHAGVAPARRHKRSQCTRSSATTRMPAALRVCLGPANGCAAGALLLSMVTETAAVLQRLKKARSEQRGRVAGISQGVPRQRHNLQHERVPNVKQHLGVGWSRPAPCRRCSEMGATHCPLP